MMGYYGQPDYGRQNGKVYRDYEKLVDAWLRGEPAGKTPYTKLGGFNCAPCGHGSRMFFDDGVIYSYGTHFPIARIVSVAPKIAFFTLRTHGVTTARHMGEVRHGLSREGFRVFNVGDVTNPGSHAENMLSYAERLRDALVRAKRARADWSRNRHETAAQELLQEGNEYGRIFTERTRLVVPVVSEKYRLGMALVGKAPAKHLGDLEPKAFLQEVR